MPESVSRSSNRFDLDMLAAIRELPPRQRAVIVARYLDDLSEATTADQLKCSIGTVKSQSAKALQSLRRSPWLAGDTPIDAALQERTAQP